MEKNVTLGGERLGSGKKNKVYLHGYERSTHNLSYNFTSTMAPGVLYPFMCIPALNEDTFSIDLDAFARTIPTKAPIFGGFKLQLDVFSVPMRLYQGILHNNPINIGLKMQQVKLPMLNVKAAFTNSPALQGLPLEERQISNSALLKYLGLSGIGKESEPDPEEDGQALKRNILAIPALAYYDIFKNYYANKQEEKAYIITGGEIEANLLKINGLSTNVDYEQGLTDDGDNYINVVHVDRGHQINYLTIYCSNWDRKLAKYLEITGYVWDTQANDWTQWGQSTLQELLDTGRATYMKYYLGDGFEIMLNIWNVCQRIEIKTTTISGDITSDLKLLSFPLENIDKMRNDILSMTELNQAFIIEEGGNYDYLPYSTLVDSFTAKLNPEDEEEPTTRSGYNIFPMNGLCVKTYQSDIFNNWLQTEWITGENGINAITAISTADGSFELDTFYLANKVYNMLNRIAVSGGTYQDWQEAVYATDVTKHAETPIYCGGMSSEINFEEVVSTAVTEDTERGQLGSLGGKGVLNGKKGGTIEIKVKEPSFIMGIVSLTPRIKYHQGNEFYMTDIQSIDDLHKPELDAIGFQDLITEQMAWWDTTIGIDDGTITRKSAGKIPAWLNYMTNYDKVFGDFANKDKAGYMVLTRDYKPDNNLNIEDLTTYIDPTKFNYAFAYTELDAQNFWIDIACQIIARRKMSAKVIPNL